MTRRSVIIHLVVVLLVAPAVRAQEPTTWRSFAEKLMPGSFVVIHLKDGADVEGRLIEVTRDNLRVLPKTRLPVPVRDLEFNRILSIDARKEGMSPGAKVLLGVGVAGGIITALLMVAMSGMR